MNCAKREQFETRIWWLSRPMLSSSGNDARTEYLSRELYTTLLETAPSVHALGFDQSAIFRRGDSALVVLAYDTSADREMAAAAAAGDGLSDAVFGEGRVTQAPSKGATTCPPFAPSVPYAALELLPSVGESGRRGSDEHRSDHA